MRDVAPFRQDAQIAPTVVAPVPVEGPVTAPDMPIVPAMRSALVPAERGLVVRRAGDVGRGAAVLPGIERLLQHVEGGKPAGDPREIAPLLGGGGGSRRGHGEGERQEGCNGGTDHRMGSQISGSPTLAPGAAAAQ